MANELATRAVEITQELAELIKRCRRRTERQTEDVIRIARLLDEVRRKQLWRHVQFDDAPCQSFTQYRRAIGADDERNFGRSHTYYLKKLEYIPDSVPEDRLRKIGVSKAAELGRLLERLPKASEHLDTWLAYAEEATHSELQSTVGEAIRTSMPALTSTDRRVRRLSIKLTESQYKNIVDIYENVYSRTTDTPTWGQFLELAAVVFRNEVISANIEGVDKQSIKLVIRKFAELLVDDDGKNVEIDAKTHVLETGDYRCSACGTRINLHVHHKVFRSHGGGDDPENLEILCERCHRELHERRAKR